MRSLKTFFSGEKASSAQHCASWLLLGGTGALSSGVTEHLRHANQVTCLNRGSRPLPAGVEQIICDVNDPQSLQHALEGRSFDVVVDFLTFTPDQARMRVQSFLGKCRRYVFISTAAAYETPRQALFITEKTPLINQFSPSAQQKVLCEGVFRAAFRQQGFPLTILRPGLCYGENDIPFILRPKGEPYALVRRMQQGKPILVPGDGTTFFTLTHSSDFARALETLAAHPDALGEDFHIAQDECMTWDAYARTIAQAAGAPQPKLRHIAAEELVHAWPALREELLGQLCQTTVFDNSKLRQFLPGFRFLTSFKDGVRQSLLRLDASAEYPAPDWNAWVDDVLRSRDPI